MTRLVRVIITASVSQFTRGINRARGTFRSFTSTVLSGAVGVVRALTGMARTLFFLREGFQALAAAARTLFDLFAGRIIAVERAEVAFAQLTGSEQQAAEMMGFLREEAQRTGTQLNQLVPVGQQVGLTLRSLQGEVDPQLWRELTREIEAFSIVTGTSMDTAGAAVSRFLSGDVEALNRLLNIEVDQIAGLSADAQAILASVSETRDQQLGRVTRLAGGATPELEDMLRVLREVEELTGADIDALEAYADTAAGRAARAQATFNELLLEFQEELLPGVNELLEALIKLMQDPATQEFAQAFGEFAAEGLESAIDALRDFDWAGFREDLEAIADAVTTIISAAGTVTGAAGGFAEEIQAGRPLSPVGRGAARVGEEIAGGVGAGLANIGGGILQRVAVTLEIDENAQINLRAAMRDEVDTGLGELVEGVSEK